MEKKSLMTRVTHSGEVEFAKKLAKGVSFPKVLPIYMSSVFSFDDVPSLDAVYNEEAEGYVYSRMENPSTNAVCEVLASAEECDGALVFSSGMAAIITSIIGNVKSGDHIIASPVLYGGVYDFLHNEIKKFNIEVTFVDFLNDNIENYVKDNTKIIYTETISNPLMEVIDIPKIAEIAKKYNCKLIVDNTFATPVIAQPLKLGADISVYSTTKFLGGHSDIIGGAICSNFKNIKKLSKVAILYGAIMSPFDAWLLSRSLRTIGIRVKQHSKNALKVAEFFENNPKVEKVYYPGLKSSTSYKTANKVFAGSYYGGMLSVDFIGGEEAASKFIEKCKLVKFVPSLAGVTTTISYPAKTSHRAYSKEELKKVGISEGQLRFSIGIEDIEDIINEFSQVLVEL